MTETVSFDDRAQAYLRSGDVAATIATSHFRLSVDDITRARWRELMGLMREVDTLADDTDATSAEVLTTLEDFSVFAPRYPHLAPDAIGELAQQAMLDRTGRILRLGEHVAQTTSLRRFVALRALEGHQTVQLFGDCATQDVTRQPRFRQEFLPHLGSLAASATLWDSLIDGRADLKAGKQALPPDLAFYKSVAAGALHAANGSLRCLVHAGPALYGGLKLVDRAVNRLRNGVPDYSNIRRLIGR